MSEIKTGLECPICKNINPIGSKNCLKCGKWLLDTKFESKAVGIANIKKNRFYNKSWFMWVACIFFAPVGLFFMWKNKKFNVIARAFLTIFFLCVFLTEIGAMDSTPTATTSSPVSQQSQPTQSVKGIPKKQNDNAKAEEKLKLKQQAEQAFNAFNKIDKQFTGILNAYNKEIKGMSDGSIDQVTAYTDLDNLHNSSLQLFSSINSLDVSGKYSDDKDSFSIAASYLENSIKELKSYLDDNKVSTMANATNDLKQAINGYNVGVMSVVTHVMGDGYIVPQKKKS